MSLLNNIKLKLWITGNDQDWLLELLLDESEAIINKLCDVDSFRESVYTTAEKWNKVWTYRVRNYPVTEVQEVNGSEDFGNLMIVFDRTLQFWSPPKPNMTMVVIKYKAWYDTLPKAIESMYVLGAIGMYNKRKNIWIQQYRLWEEQITFATIEDAEIFGSILDAYKKVDVIG